MNRFFHSEPLLQPESIRPFLADPVHWREGRSAFELAHSWIGAGDIPSRVRAVLDTCEVFRNAALIEGFFEHQTNLRSHGRPSQTDLLAVLRLSEGELAVVAVEGKAGEPFGPILSDWNDGFGKKKERLKVLCDYFGLDSNAVLNIRYQLLHRTAAAMFEAERYGARQAMTMIHSFSSSDAGLDDYRSFVQALGIESAEPDQISSPRNCHGIELRFGWVNDSPLLKPAIRDSGKVVE